MEYVCTNLSKMRTTVSLGIFQIIEINANRKVGYGIRKVDEDNISVQVAGQAIECLLIVH